MAARRRLAAVPDRAARGVVYVRVSALMGRGGDSFHSPDLQAAAVRRMFDDRAVAEVEVVEDLDVSGRTFTREGLDRVLALARTGQITAVGVYDLSRLGRDTAQSLRHIRELRDLGVAVMSTVEQIDDSPEGQFMLTQFLAMAQLYSDQIGRRWQSAIAAVVARGEWPRAAPIGYLKAGRTLAPDPVLAAAVTDLFAGYAAGRPLADLGADLSAARGIQTRRFVVRSLLDSETYLGRIPTAAGPVPGLHPPLVDERIWAQVRARRATDGRTPSRTIAAAHPLAGVLICDGCGTAAWVRPPSRGRTDVRRYVCGRRGEGLGCPGCGALPVDQVLDVVLEQIRQHAEKLGARAASRAVVASRRSRARTDVDRLGAEIGRVEVGLGRLAADRALRSVSEAAYAAGARRLEEELLRIRALLVRAEATAGAPAGADLAPALRDLLALWADGEDPDRNLLVRSVVGEVRIRRASAYREPAVSRVSVRLL